MNKEQEDKEMRKLFDKSNAGFQSDFISTSEYQENGHLGNIVKFAADDVQRIDVKYFHAKVSILPNLNDDEHVIFKEYFSKVSAEYKGKSELDNGTLTLEQGSEPETVLWNRPVHVIVLIPFGYEGDFRVSLDKGNVLLDTIKHVGITQVNVKSGKASFNNVEAKALSASGEKTRININNSIFDDALKIDGNRLQVSATELLSNQFDVGIKNGIARFNGISGSSFFRMNQGSIRLNFKEVNGDVSAQAEVGSIWLHLPGDTSFKFDLTLKTGRIKTVIGDKTHFADQNKKHVSGSFGNDPSFVVDASTQTGSIHML